MTDSPELGRDGRGPHGPGPLEAALDAVNDQFHEAYDGAKREAKHECPVFVMLADTLVAFHRGVRTEYRCTPDAFQCLKAVSHVPVALYAELQRIEGDATVADRARLEALLKRSREGQSKLQAEGARLGLTAETARDVRTILDQSLELLERALSSNPVNERDAFARAVGPVLLRLMHEATRLQLESLHASVERALQPLSAAEREELHVVVTGDHQARSRSLGMQYFKQRLGEPEHSEERVAYAEGVSDEQEAFALVGTRRLDHAVAAAFFGDRKRLQRDLLGDSAAELLRDQPFEPI